MSNRDIRLLFFGDIRIKKIKLFRKVYMGIDMVLAETVISRTAGAVTELELRKLGIGPAADGAFMRIKLAALLLPDPAGFFPKIDGAFGIFLRKHPDKRRSEKDEEI